MPFSLPPAPARDDPDQPSAAPAPLRLIDKRTLLAKVPLSYPTIWALMRSGEFPRSRAVGEGRIFWVEHEVDQWIAARPVARLKGDDAS
jgi:predicted DNA-binding transcriptional regulator AlpA